MRSFLGDDHTKCRYGDHDWGDNRNLYEHSPADPLPLFVLVRVPCVEVQRDDVDSPETLGVLPVLMLKAEETPYSPPEQLYRHWYRRQIRGKLELGTCTEKNSKQKV